MKLYLFTLVTVLVILGHSIKFVSFADASALTEERAYIESIPTYSQCMDDAGTDAADCADKFDADGAV